MQQAKSPVLFLKFLSSSSLPRISYNGLSTLDRRNNKLNFLRQNNLLPVDIFRTALHGVNRAILTFLYDSHNIRQQIKNRNPQKPVKVRKFTLVYYRGFNYNAKLLKFSSCSTDAHYLT